MCCLQICGCLRSVRKIITFSASFLFHFPHRRNLWMSDFHNSTRWALCLFDCCWWVKKAVKTILKAFEWIKTLFTSFAINSVIHRNKTVKHEPQSEHFYQTVSGTWKLNFSCSLSIIFCSSTQSTWSFNWKMIVASLQKAVVGFEDLLIVVSQIGQRASP